MRVALYDLWYLWRTRRSSGFPWPFARGVGPWWAYAYQLALGYPHYAPRPPLWRRVVGIPLRPVRYARMVRGVARTRATFVRLGAGQDAVIRQLHDVEA